MGMSMGSFASRVVATKVVALDGSGDFTDIQEAINDLPVIGGAVYIKEGTYIGDIVINKNNVRIIGAGKSSHIKGTITATNVSGIQIRDLQLETITASRNIISGCNEFEITGCFIHGTASIGIWILVTERSIISNNQIYGHGDGILVTGNDVGVSVGPVKDCTIIGNTIYDNGNTGISLHSTPINECDNVIITANRIFNNGTGIFLNAPNCNRNILVANSLVGFIFGPIDDNGTGTEIAHNTV